MESRLSVNEKALPNRQSVRQQQKHEHSKHSEHSEHLEHLYLPYMFTFLKSFDTLDSRRIAVIFSKKNIMYYRSLRNETRIETKHLAVLA